MRYGADKMESFLRPLDPARRSLRWGNAVASIAFTGHIPTITDRKSQSRHGRSDTQLYLVESILLLNVAKKRPSVPCTKISIAHPLSSNLPSLIACLLAIPTRIIRPSVRPSIHPPIRTKYVQRWRLGRKRGSPLIYIGKRQLPVSITWYGAHTDP